MKRRFPCAAKRAAVLVWGLSFFVGNVFAATVERLKVTVNRRYLQYESGKPFFYLGDTAWELFHKLNREEAAKYLTNRAQKGFTVIQATVLAAGNGLTVPNAYGDLPFIDKDATRPNEAYFKHVDFIVNKAAELGLFIGMLPSWGNYWASSTVFFTPEAAKQYGRFLGARYRDKPIIWILGGDHFDHQRKRAHDCGRACCWAYRGRWRHAPQDLSSGGAGAFFYQIE
jgi:hypothetical protein